LALLFYQKIAFLAIFSLASKRRRSFYRNLDRLKNNSIIQTDLSKSGGDSIERSIITNPNQKGGRDETYQKFMDGA
jgi:hypothetical protein